MIRAVAILLFLLAVASLLARTSVQASGSTTVLSGGDLPHTVRLAPADEDAFMRRINLPPKLDAAPKTSGAAYTVTSAYWDDVLRVGRDDRPPGEAEATYFPSGGFVRARQGGRDAWLALDVRQQAILNRYIRLTRDGLLSESPGVFEVVRAAAKGEAISVSIGSRELSPDETRRFWDAADAAQLRSGPAAATPPASSGGSLSTWIVFSLPEGRSVTMQYAVVSSVLTDRLASEAYAVPARWLVPVLGPSAEPGPNFGLTPGEVEQQAGRGSPVWWLVMIGGGIAALAIAFRLSSAFKTAPGKPAE